jgi:hypothetical protein
MSTGTTTYKGRVKRALAFKQQSSLWACVGRKTAWTDENDPPVEEPATEYLDEPICYAAPSVITVCKQVSSGGDVTVEGQKYAFVSDGDAYTENARFVYLKALFDPDSGQPNHNFRRTGVYSGLTPQAGYESRQWLDPANVSDPGVLEYLDNHREMSLGPGESRQIEIVIEFR